jgi:hypothetical protein
VKLLAALIKWAISQIEGETAPEPYQPPYGHTLTLTVGPIALKHEFRCHEPASAPCRRDREEADGCLYVEAMNESEKPWYALTVDGWDEEFPPMQVDFIDAGGGEFHWYDPSVGS